VAALLLDSGTVSSSYASDTITYTINGGNWINAGSIGGGVYTELPPKPDGPLDWLDRRVEEMRVKL